MGHYQLDCGCYVDCKCTDKVTPKPLTDTQKLKEEIQLLKYYIKTNSSTVKQITTKITKHRKQLAKLIKKVQK